MRVPLAWLRDYVDAARTTRTTIVDAACDARVSGRSGRDARPRSRASSSGSSTKSRSIPTPTGCKSARSTSVRTGTLTIATAADKRRRRANRSGRDDRREARRQLTIEPRKMRGIDVGGHAVLRRRARRSKPDWFEDGILQLDRRHAARGRRRRTASASTETCSTSSHAQSRRRDVDARASRASSPPRSRYPLREPDS